MSQLNTKLVVCTISGTTKAPERLGKLVIERGLKLVPVTFFPFRLPCQLHVVIPKGFVALVNANGKYVGIWKAGFHIAMPWITVSHLIPMQYTVYDIPVKECPTQDNVMVTIDVTLIFRVMCEDEKSIYNFCYRLGPEKLDKMLRAFQEEAIRGMVRKRRYNEIYDLMDSNHDKQLDGTKRDLNNHFNEYGVEITSLAVTNVHLPKEFADNMQEESIWGTRDEFNKLEQQFSLQKIDIKEKEAKKKQKTMEDLAEYTATQDERVAEYRKKLDLVKAETNKQIAEILEMQHYDELSINSNAKLTVAEINAKRDIQSAKIKQTGRAEAARIRTETHTYVLAKKAEAQLEIATNHAQTVCLNASAESEVAVQLVAKRDYEKKMRSLQTIRSLANNDNVSISGNNKDNLVAQLVANSRNANVLGLNIA